MGFSFSVNPYVLKASALPERLANHTLKSYPEHEAQWQVALEHFAQLKGRYSEVYLELGSGSGQHLLSCAQQNPRALFVGIEWRYKRAFRTAEKGIREGLENFYVLRGDFQILLKELFPAHSLSGVSMHFPDPWEKRRWKKHRPLAVEFFQELAARLNEGAFFSLKTGHKEYFESLCAYVTTDEHICPYFHIEKLSQDLYNSEYLSGNIPTEFEQLFLSKQLPIYFIELKRTGKEVTREEIAPSSSVLERGEGSDQTVAKESSLPG